MLVLSRFREESLYLSGGIRILICGVDGGKVKIGIEAPDEIIVSRDPDILAEKERARGGSWKWVRTDSGES